MTMEPAYTANKGHSRCRKTCKDTKHRH